MSYERCPICQTYDFTDRHTCPPKWHCWPDEEREEDGSSIHAKSAQDAAEKWCERLDHHQVDYQNGERIIRVRKDYETAVERFAVYAEPVMEYTAHPAQPLVPLAPIESGEQ